MINRLPKCWVRQRGEAAVVALRNPTTFLARFVCLGILLAPPLARAQFLIAPQYPISLGSGAYDGVGIAVADFNHDGKMDLVTSPGGGLYINVALGNGDGTLQPAVQYSTGGFGFSDSVAVGDFNRDGNPDIAVVANGVVSILLGNGDGTFQPYTIYPAPAGAVFGAVADFNGDGKPDIVVTANNVVAILFGNGDGTFAPAVQYAVGAVGPVAVGDLNGDGKPDVVVGNQVTPGGSNTVGVLLNKGDGTLGPITYYPLNNSPIGALFVNFVAVADFNGDGKMDVASWNPQPLLSPSSGQVSIFLGNGDGTLQPNIDYPVGSGYVTFGGSGITVGDFNSDGKRDVAVNNVVDNTISVLYGNGDGTFQVHQDYGVESGPAGILAGDFNGDHKDDLAVVNSYSGTISILLSTPSGRLLSDPFYATGKSPSAVAVGDFNGDGKLDIAVANGNPNNAPSQSVSVLLGNGDGTFQPRQDYPTGNFPLSLATADFNGDGHLDLVVANAGDNTISILLANGDGTFRPKVDYPTGVQPWSVAVGDFNGDGKTDLAVAAVGTNAVSVLLGNGDGTFQSHVDYATGGRPVFVVVADFNGDGRLDLATASASGGTVSVLLGKGDGTFGTHSDFGAGGPPLSLAVGDLNHDGKIDLVVADGGEVCEASGYCPASANLAVLLGNGDGSFQPPVNYPAAAGPQSVVVGDFNGDGKPDIAVANSNFHQSDAEDNPILTGSTFSVFWGNGDGTFRSRVDYLTRGGSYAAAVGDFNGDHKDDLAVVAANSNGVDVMLNTANNPHLLSVAVSAGGGAPGAVVSSIGGIICGVFCAAAYNNGTVVTLAPTPAAGLGFTGWSGDCSGTGSCVLTMTADHSVTANFVSINYMLSINTPGSGTGLVIDYFSGAIDCGDGASYCSFNYAAGSVVELAATADPGMTFAGWSGGGCSGTLPCLVTLDADTTVTATFTLPAGDTVLTVAGAGTASGTVNSSPGGINLCLSVGVSCGADPSVAAFPKGTTIALTATPDPISFLAGWSGGGCSGTGRCTVTLNSNQTVTATFSPLLIITVEEGPATVSAGQLATFTLGIQQNDGFNATVSFTCSVQPMPALAPQCSINPSSAGPGIAPILTVTTTGPTTAQVSPRGFWRGLYALWLPLLAFSLLRIRFGSHQNSKRRLNCILTTGMLAAGLLLYPACGGGGNAGGGGHTNPGTPAGTYTITVTGTSSAAPSATTTATLVVQ